MVKPTRGIERSEFTIFGQKIVFWDYGGQEKYRIKYLKKKERYFLDIDTMFYVVDIQDTRFFIAA